MSKKIVAATTATLLGAFALAATAVAQSSDAPKMDMMGKEKCYGIAAKGKNDCAAGAHSCAGHATMDRDKDSYVILPAGACAKLAGGTTMAGGK
jgi:uncharacterized membrane protein